MSDDPYLELVHEQWDNIETLFRQFRDKDQIIEFDVVEQKIYSRPAGDYIQTLSERTRGETARLFADSKKNKKFLLFVIDSKNRKLRSYVFDSPE